MKKKTFEWEFSSDLPTHIGIDGTMAISWSYYFLIDIDPRMLLSVVTIKLVLGSSRLVIK